MPLLLTISYSSKSRLVLPSWRWLTWVVPDKIQDSHKMVFVCVKMFLSQLLTKQIISRDVLPSNQLAHYWRY